MALQYYDSPFHVTHDEEKANQMARVVDLSILMEQQGCTEEEAAKQLDVAQRQASDLKNTKI